MRRGALDYFLGNGYAKKFRSVKRVGKITVWKDAGGVVGTSQILARAAQWKDPAWHAELSLFPTPDCAKTRMNSSKPLILTLLPSFRPHDTLTL
jgi:hypothetical protein